MKNSIKLAALLLTFSTGLFAANPPISVPHNSLSTENVTFSILSSGIGINLSIKGKTSGKARIEIYDEYANLIFSEILSPDKNLERAYVLRNFENGDYVIDVFSDKKTTKEDFQVYNGQCAVR